MHFIRLMIVGIAIAVLAGCASDKNNGSVGIRMSDLSAGALSGQGETGMRAKRPLFQLPRLPHADKRSDIPLEAFVVRAIQ